MDFSNKLIARTKDLGNQVDSLVFETEAMDVKVHNVFNQFLMLSNVQFIENVNKNRIKFCIVDNIFLESL